MIMDANGVPLAANVNGANRHDVTPLLPPVQVIPPITGKRGRPLQRPKSLYADRA